MTWTAYSCDTQRWVPPFLADYVFMPLTPHPFAAQHAGPVERKGPEHYANDDDDSEEDNEGGDAEDGDTAEGGGASGSGGGAAGAGGPSSRFSPPDNGRRGESEKGQGVGKSNKRKARTGHRMTDGHSMSSEGSSKRGSPPVAAGAPIIKVEGQDEGGEVSRDVLKAAIIQRSISKPGGGGRPSSSMHHHSFSGGDVYPRSGLAMSAATSPSGAVQMHSVPHRPYTAGAMTGMPVSSSGMLSQQPSRPQGSPPRFAYSPDGANLNPNMALSGGYLRPQQQWSDGSMSGQQLMRTDSSSSMTSHDVSYGDLAGSPATSPFRMHQMPQSALPSPSAVNAAQNYASLQSPQHSQNHPSSSLMPLAHPILRQHPQYESYANQLRMQQHHFQGSRNVSQPSISVHTAPSSPNHLKMDGGQAAGTMATLEAPHSGSHGAKRSASFGYPGTVKHDFQQAVQHDPMQFVNPFDSNSRGETDPGSQRQPSSQAAYNTNSFNGRPDFAFGQSNAMPPPPYGHPDSHSTATSSEARSSLQQNESDVPISNAAFNDLMGSILSDMGSTTSGTTAGSGTMASSDERAKENLKEQEDVIRSMESDGSLSTLVNNESFDALMGGNDTIKSDESTLNSTSKQGDLDGQDNQAARLTVETRDASSVS